MRNRGFADETGMSYVGTGRYYGASPIARGQGPMPSTDPRAASAGQRWTPTVANLLVLIVAEIIVFAGLRRLFRVVQGG